MKNILKNMLNNHAVLFMMLTHNKGVKIFSEFLGQNRSCDQRDLLDSLCDISHAIDDLISWCDVTCLCT